MLEEMPPCHGGNVHGIRGAIIDYDSLAMGGWVGMKLGNGSLSEVKQLLVSVELQV
jgi:hypothetical protein